MNKKDREFYEKITKGIPDFSYSRLFLFVLCSLPDMDINKKLIHPRNLLGFLWIMFFNPFTVLVVISMILAMILTITTNENQGHL